MWGDKAQVAARYTLVFIFLMLYGYSKKIKTKIPRDKLIYALGLGVSFALVVLLFTFALQKTTLANTLFTFYATNLVTSFLLGTFILKERVSGTKLLAIVLAVVGLSLYSGALIVGSLGIIFSCVAGVFAGIGNLLTKCLSGVDRNAVLRTQYVVGTVITILLTLISRDEIIRSASFRGVILTFIFAFILITAGNLLLYGYQHIDVNIGTVLMSTELVFGALLGLIIYHEVPAPHELLGGVLIFTGSVVGSLDFKKLPRVNHIDFSG